MVWPDGEVTPLAAMMSDAYWIYSHAPVVAVQRNERMEYLDDNGEVAFVTNRVWPRAHLVMARLIDTTPDP